MVVVLWISTFSKQVLGGGYPQVQRYLLDKFLFIDEGLWELGSDCKKVISGGVGEQHLWVGVVIVVVVNQSLKVSDFNLFSPILCIHERVELQIGLSLHVLVCFEQLLQDQVVLQVIGGES